MRGANAIKNHSFIIKYLRTDVISLYIDVQAQHTSVFHTLPDTTHSISLWSHPLAECFLEHTQLSPLCLPHKGENLPSNLYGQHEARQKINRRAGWYWYRYTSATRARGHGKFYFDTSLIVLVLTFNSVAPLQSHPPSRYAPRPSHP